MAIYSNCLKKLDVAALFLFLMAFSVFLFPATSYGGMIKDGAGQDIRWSHVLPNIEKTDSVPGVWESMTIRRKTGDQDVLMKLENGEIALLEIDGKVIEKSEYSQYQELIDAVKPGGNAAKSNGLYFQWGDTESFGRMELNEGMMDSLLREFSSGSNTPSFRKGESFDSLGGIINLDSMMAQMSTWVKQWQNQWPEGESWQFESDEDEPELFLQPESSENAISSEGFDSILGNALNKDGLLIPGKDNNIELTYKHLKINGEKQPENIFQKYKRIFESAAGTPLQKKSQIKFSYVGKESSRKYRVY